MLHTHKNKLKESHPEDRLLSLRVTPHLHSLRQTGEILFLLPCPSFAVSLSQGMCRTARPPPPSPASLQKYWNLTNTPVHSHAQAPWLQAGSPDAGTHTQAGSLRRALWQFTFVRTLQIWPSLDQAASFSSFLHKQPHPCCWRRAASPSVITSFMPWCNEENIRESDRGCGLKKKKVKRTRFSFLRLLRWQEETVLCYNLSGLLHLLFINCVSKHTKMHQGTNIAHTGTQTASLFTDLAECVSALLVHSQIGPEPCYLCWPINYTLFH